MGHGALAGAQAGRFVHAQQADVEAQLVVDERNVHDALGAVAEFADIAPEEDGQAGTQHGDAGVLEGRHVDVDVGDAAAADDVAQAVDGEQGQGRVAGVVDEGDEARDGGRGEVARRRPDVGGEGEGRGADLAGAAGAVGELPGEGLGGVRRRAQGEGEDGVDLLHHLGLGSGDRGGGGRGGGEQCAEEEGVLAELGEDDAVDDAGGHGVVRVRVENLRD